MLKYHHVSVQSCFVEIPKLILAQAELEIGTKRLCGREFQFAYSVASGNVRVKLLRLFYRIIHQ